MNEDECLDCGLTDCNCEATCEFCGEPSGDCWCEWDGLDAEDEDE